MTSPSSIASALIASAFALVSIGCSSGGGGPELLTCEWLTENNCYQQLIETARACAPMGTGTFDANAEICTYADGSEVALTLGTDADSWATAANKGFEVRRDGSTCLAYEQMGADLLTANWSFEASGGVFTAESEPGRQIWTCPDGEQFEITQEFLTCADYITRSPQVTTSSTSTSFSLIVRGVDPVYTAASCITP